MLYLWVSAVAFGAVSFSIVPAPAAVALAVLALGVAFGVTLIPLRQGKIGRRPRATSVVLETDPS